MDLIDNSNHICLICNQTIVGLLNYVEHFKSHATPQTAHIADEKCPLTSDANSDLCPANSGGSDKIKSNTSVHQVSRTVRNAKPEEPDTGDLSGDALPFSEFIDNSNLPEPDLDDDELLSPKHCSDFFQSLELKSATEEVRPKPRLKAVQRLSILEDDLHAESLLPITAILSNLDFSSDDDNDDLEFPGSEDRDRSENESYWFSDDGDHPPQGHTGGKWKPGEGPKRRPPIASKWKPGQRPGPACRKSILSRVKKPRIKEESKSFLCTVCNVYFKDRNAYTLHFSQSEHKEKAASKKQEKATEFIVDKSTRNVEKNNKSPSSQSSMKAKRAEDRTYCPACDLFFDSTLVFSTHCETKLHKDAMLKRGFREFKGSDGTIIRIDIHDDKVYKESEVEAYAALNRNKDKTSLYKEAVQAECHECIICQKVFTRKYEMARHLLTRMHSARATKHPQADSLEMLNKYNKYMTRLSPFQCGVCQFYFNRQKDFLDHMGSESHVQTCEDMLGPLNCVACKFKTHKHEEMMEHLQLADHLSEVEKKHGICIVRESHTRITCKFCGVKMHSAVRMKRHCERKHSDRLSEVQVSLTVKPTEMKVHHCPVCKKPFRVKSILQLHFLKVHKNTVHFKCDVCNRGFQDQRRLDDHLRTRYHARRVIAKKTGKPVPGKNSHSKTGLERKKTPIAKKEIMMKRRGRTPKTEEKKEPPKPKLKTIFKKVQKEQVTPDVQESHKDIGLRRSSRKRKKIGFFDDDTEVEKVNTRPASKETKLWHVKKRSGRQRATGDEVIEYDENQFEADKSAEKSSAEHSLASANLIVNDEGYAVKTIEREVANSTGSQEENADVKLSKRQKNNSVKEKLRSRKIVSVSNALNTTDNSSVSEDKQRKKQSKETMERNFEGSELDDDDDDVSFTEEFDDNDADEDYAVNEEVESEDSENGDEEELPVSRMGKYKTQKPSAKKEMSEELNEEELTEASKHIFSCSYCDFAATDLVGLRTHYTECHPNDILTCQACNQYFLSLKAYKIHCSGRGHQLKLREQSGETKIYKCHVCEKRFLQESCCNLHIETVHRHPSCEADIQRIHKGKDLVTQLYGDHVKQIENLSNETSVSCPECGKFVKKETLVEHLRLHTGERPYTCRFCPKTFAGRLSLRRHISSHLNMPLFICDHCGKEFKRNALLVKHVQQHELEKKGERHTCDVCKAWFYTPEELERHSKRHGERKFKCTWPGCNWTFVLSNELKSHMYTHTGERKYLCDKCGFGAPTKTRLKRHAKTHQKVRSFTCEYCPYKASCKIHLRRHMRIHINSKPFACPYCSYTCNTHENMRKHILKTQKHKGMKLYPCKLCSFGANCSKEFKVHILNIHGDYLRKHALDSLSMFSGIYNKDDDYQKPKEGSEIIQVTKGRFFRTYQNPEALVEPPKPKKQKKTNKLGEVKVIIVPPSELDVDNTPQQNQQTHAGEEINGNNFENCQVHPSQQQVFQPEHNTSPSHQLSVQQSILRRELSGTMAAGVELSGSDKVEVIPAHSEATRPPYQETQREVSNNLTLHSYCTPQRSQSQVQQQLVRTSVAFAPAVVQHHPQHLQQHVVHQQHQQQLQQQQHLQQQQIRVENQQQQQQLPMTVTVGNEKVFWTVISDQNRTLTQQSVSNNVVSSGHSGQVAPSPEPWYSGMPQVHAPSTQELRAHFRPVMSTNVNGQASATFLPSTYQVTSNIPAGSIQQVQGMPSGSVGAPLYTASVMDNNIIVLNEAQQQNGSGVL